MSDSFGLVMADFDCFVVLYLFRPIMTDRDLLVVPTCSVRSFPDIHTLVVLYLLLLIVLRVNIDQLRCPSCH